MRFPSKASPSEGYRRYSCDESTENSYGKFGKEKHQFHPYKRQFSDVFPESLNSLSLGEKPFKGMDGMESFDNVCGPPCPEDTETFAPLIPDISDETAWCNNLQYTSSHKEGSQMMVRVSSASVHQQILCLQDMKTICVMETSNLAGGPALASKDLLIPNSANCTVYLPNGIGNLY